MKRSMVVFLALLSFACSHTPAPGGAIHGRTVQVTVTGDRDVALTTVMRMSAVAEAITVTSAAQRVLGSTSVEEPPVSREISPTAPARAIHGVIITDGVPLPGVTVTLSAPGQPARVIFSDVNGHYAFGDLAPGVYTVDAEMESMTRRTVQVTVTGDQDVTLTTEMQVSAVAESITVTTGPPAVLESTEGMSIPHESSSEMYPAEFITEPLVPLPIGAVTTPYAYYPRMQEHELAETEKERIATFTLDVGRASYANIRRYLRDGMVPPPDAVRIEEMVNYFTYSYPQPSDDAPFTITTEVAGCPWNPEHRLLRVGVQGRNLEQWRMAPNNLVFLIDVSGSMDGPDRLALIKDAFAVLVDQLRAEDRISIVVYADAASLVLPPVSGAEKGRILEALTMLSAGGSTAAGDGIELAYRIAKENFLEQGNNRVILATDGDFNAGISTVPELEAFIEKKHASNIFLSVLGVGRHELRDSVMETLADKGNGNYAYLDSLEEARKVFRDELTGTLVTIAKDVKVQLELNPAAVQAYRPIGYENRALQTNDFDDDKKDAGELGAGHSVTALFEIVPARYGRGDLGTLRLRYKDPRGATSRRLEAKLIDEGRSAYEASADLQFAAAVAEMGMLLRGSAHKGNASWDDVFQLARVSLGADLDGRRQEFLQIAEAAKKLK